MKICYRFGVFYQKKLFKKYKELYDEIMVNAYMFELYEDAITLFLLNIDKPYIIDPATFIFHTFPGILRNKHGEPKKHYKKLGQKYGTPFDSIVGKRRINPADFNSLNNQEVDRLCERFINYQKTRLASKIMKVRKYIVRYQKLKKQGKITKKDSEFLEKFEGIIEKYNTENIPRPERLIPPYFLAEYPSDPHFDLSLRLSKKCVQFKEDMDLYPVIFLSKEFLAYDNSIDMIVDRYDWEGFDGYYIWINDFNEKFETLDHLQNLKILVNSLKERTSKPIINLYSGYFSVLLYHFGMTGIVSGICHSSSKNIFESTGKPPDKYYLNYVHLKAILEDAERIHRFYTDFTCKCPACREGISKAQRFLAKGHRIPGSPEKIFISAGMDTESRGAHFLYSRKKETDEIIHKTLSTSINELDNIIKISNERNVPTVLLDRKILAIWINALS